MPKLNNMIDAHFTSIYARVLFAAIYKLFSIKHLLTTDVITYGTF